MLADSARPILERPGDRAVVRVHDDALVLLGPLQVARARRRRKREGAAPAAAGLLQPRDR